MNLKTVAAAVVDGTARGDVLAAFVASVAASWMEAYVRLLESEGRAVEGSWPGTMPEARMQVMRRTGQAGTDGHLALTAAEISECAARVYKEVQRTWRKRARAGE